LDSGLIDEGIIDEQNRFQYLFTPEIRNVLITAINNWNAYIFTKVSSVYDIYIYDSYDSYVINEAYKMEVSFNNERIRELYAHMAYSNDQFAFKNEKLQITNTALKKEKKRLRTLLEARNSSSSKRKPEDPRPPKPGTKEGDKKPPAKK
jgi:hypothetical protein